MQIDKAHFLFLVGALTATSACIVREVDDDDDGVGGFAGSPNGGTGAAGGSGGSVGGEGGEGGEGGTGGAGGAACGDDMGEPDACSATCESFISCDPIATDLKAGVLEQTVDCINALDTTTCTYLETEACMVTALANACGDETTELLCTDLATNCSVADDDAWRAHCHDSVDGLTEAGRNAVLSCTQQGVCSSEGLLQPCLSNLWYL